MSFFWGGDRFNAEDSGKMVVLLIVEKTQELKRLGFLAIGQVLILSSLVNTELLQFLSLPWSVNYG